MATSEFHRTPCFPHHDRSRTWLITAGLNASGIRLARLLLCHGDNVALGVPPATYDEVSANPDNPNPFARPESERLRQFLHEDFTPSPDTHHHASPSSPGTDSSPTAAPDKPDRVLRPGVLRAVRLDARSTAQCQGAVAQAVGWFGSVDVLVCNAGEVLVGAVEELGATSTARAMLREQFEGNFFANVNAIKGAIPAMRKRGGGHVIVLTGITSHLGTPGLGAFCAAGWALEGYCDSIAYEIAPFNIKLSIIQPQLEAAVLPNRIRSVPLLDHYSPSTHPAPLSRNSIGTLLDRIHGLTPPDSHPAQSPLRRNSAASTSTTASDEGGGGGGGGADSASNSASAASSKRRPRASRPLSRSLGSGTEASVVEPELPPGMADALLAETLFSICAIGGHPNPPQRHIVGSEGVVSVKEKLKTVSVELEDLVGTSVAVDINGGVEDGVGVGTGVGGFGSSQT